MLKAGICICPRCGHIIDEPYYRNAEYARGVFLKYDSKNHEQYVSDEKNPDNGHRVCLKTAMQNRGSGLPHEITVIYREEELEMTMKHSCQHCDSNTVLWPSFGKLPIFVIPVIGGREAGKSAWLSAIAYTKNLNHLRRGNLPYKLIPRQLMTQRSVAEVTPVQDLGQTNYFTVKNEQDEEIAGILLRDIPGELFDEETEVTNGENLWRFLNKNDLYSGPDAYIFVSQAAREADTKATKAYNALSNNSANPLLDGNAPVGIVLTHVDLEMENSPLEDDIPILNQHTFPKDSDSTYYKIDEMKKRFALEHMLAGQLSSFAKTVFLNKKPSHGFLVQSCVDRMDKNGAPERDHEEAINVMDPLLWVLHQINLFPLEGGDES